MTDDRLIRLLKREGINDIERVRAWCEKAFGTRDFDELAQNQVDLLIAKIPHFRNILREESRLEEARENIIWQLDTVIAMGAPIEKPLLDTEENIKAAQKVVDAAIIEYFPDIQKIRDEIAQAHIELGRAEYADRHYSREHDEGIQKIEQLSAKLSAAIQCKINSKKVK